MLSSTIDLQEQIETIVAATVDQDLVVTEDSLEKLPITRGVVNSQGD